MYNACLILCSVFYGALYYQEYHHWQPIGHIFFPLGCATVMGGVMLLSLHSATGTKGVKVDPAGDSAGSGEAYSKAVSSADGMDTAQPDGETEQASSEAMP